MSDDADDYSKSSGSRSSTDYSSGDDIAPSAAAPVPQAHLVAAVPDHSTSSARLSTSKASSGSKSKNSTSTNGGDGEYREAADSSASVSSVSASIDYSSDEYNETGSPRSRRSPRRSASSHSEASATQSAQSPPARSSRPPRGPVPVPVPGKTAASPVPRQPLAAAARYASSRTARQTARREVTGGGPSADPTAALPPRQLLDRRRRLEIKRRGVITQNVRRPGEPPATRLPPTTPLYDSTRRSRTPTSKASKTLSNGAGPLLRAAPSIANPHNIRVDYVTSQRVVLRWNEPKDLPKGISGKDLEYKVLLSGDKGRTFETSLTASKRLCEIRNLVPNSGYHALVVSHPLGDAPAAVSRKFTEIHFTTRPLPQVPPLCAHEAPTSLHKEPLFACPAVPRQLSPLYSRIGVPTWLK
ncbi:hypothetical protein DIPPA_09886 [Diplonema papillatum]|nr:hypothetical protein DIPPA_09886 [Diplonema papillatum]